MANTGTLFLGPQLYSKKERRNKIKKFPLFCEEKTQTFVLKTLLRCSGLYFGKFWFQMESDPGSIRTRVHSPPRDPFGSWLEPIG